MVDIRRFNLECTHFTYSMGFSVISMKNTYYFYFIGPLNCIQSCVLCKVLGCF